LRTSRSDDTRFDPQMSAAERLRRRTRWQQAVDRTRSWNE
jgi:glycerol kinase